MGRRGVRHGSGQTDLLLSQEGHSGASRILSLVASQVSLTTSHLTQYLTHPACSICRSMGVAVAAGCDASPLVTHIACSVRPAPSLPAALSARRQYGLWTIGSNNASTCARKDKRSAPLVHVLKARPTPGTCRQRARTHRRDVPDDASRILKKEQITTCICGTQLRV